MSDVNYFEIAEVAEAQLANQAVGGESCRSEPCALSRQSAIRDLQKGPAGFSSACLPDLSLCSVVVAARSLGQRLFDCWFGYCTGKGGVASWA